MSRVFKLIKLVDGAGPVETPWVSIEGAVRVGVAYQASANADFYLQASILEDGNQNNGYTSHLFSATPAFTVSYAAPFSGPDKAPPRWVRVSCAQTVANLKVWIFADFEEG
jgi:hypothetical protein